MIRLLREIRDLLREIRDLLNERLDDRHETHCHVVSHQTSESFDAAALANTLKRLGAEVGVLKGAHDAGKESRRVFEAIVGHGSHDAPGGAS